MKRNLLFIALFISMLSAFSQAAKKPSIMVVPSDIYCVRAGATMEFDNQGTKVVLPDYKKLLQTDANMRLVITKIGAMMAERGFPLKDLEQTMKNIEQRNAESSMMTSKDEGSPIAESPIDILKRTAKSDIIMEIDFEMKRQGPKKYVTFNLKGLDAYTGKQVAAGVGTGQPATSSQPEILVEEAVLQHIDNFNAQLMTHFEDMFSKGREVTVMIKVWEDADFGDLETEFGDDELNEIIDAWFADNTQEGRFSQTDASENFMQFEQVRIPLFNAKGRALDTKKWIKGLRKMLKKEPFEIPCKVYMRGLGEAWLVLGGK